MAEENKKKQGVSSYSSTCPPPHTAPAPGPLDTSPPMLSGAPRRASLSRGGGGPLGPPSQEGRHLSQSPG